MRYLVSAAEMKQYDSNTIEKTGIPACVLMERAALGALEVIEEHFKAGPEKLEPKVSDIEMSARQGWSWGCNLECSIQVLNRCQRGVFTHPLMRRAGRCKLERGSVLVMAGVGNNGGDGLALARLLSERQYNVEVWCVGDRGRASAQWLQQEKILKHYPVRILREPSRRAYDVLVDALFGVGLSRDITGEFALAVAQYNEMGGFKLALDLPSGIDSDTGEILGCAAGADVTVTFGFCKRGLALYPGCQYAGSVKVAEAGISEAGFYGQQPQMFAYDEGAGELLPRRRDDGNKGTFGKVLLVAGSRNMAGAAVLAARAAYRVGAGMVKVATPEDNRVILQQAVPEALLETGEDLTASLNQWADVVAVGPGLGRDERARRLLAQVIEKCSLPLVLDADALNLLAESPEILDALGRQGAADKDNDDDNSKGRKIVLTPHVGELSRLTGLPVSTLKRDLPGYGQELAARIHGVVVAKDARTFTCGENLPVCLNLTGNSGMATAGSGDVLAGVIAGLLGQGMDSFEAASVGVYLHGMAGDAAAADLGEHACMAGDIVEALAGL